MSEIKNVGKTWMAKCNQLVPLPFKGLNFQVKGDSSAVERSHRHLGKEHSPATEATDRALRASVSAVTWVACPQVPEKVMWSLQYTASFVTIDIATHPLHTWTCLLQTTLSCCCLFGIN